MSKRRPAARESAFQEKRLGTVCTIAGVFSGVGISAMLAKYSVPLTIAGCFLCIIVALVTGWLYREDLKGLANLKITIPQASSLVLISVNVVMPLIILLTDPTRPTPLLSNISGMWGDRNCTNTVRILATSSTITITPVNYPNGAYHEPTKAVIQDVGVNSVSTKDIKQSDNGLFASARFTLHDVDKVDTLEWDDFLSPPRFLDRCG